MTDTPTPDTTNDFFFGSNGWRIVPVLPVVVTTRQQAYRAAAWLKAMALVLPEEQGQEGVTAESVEMAVNAS